VTYHVDLLLDEERRSASPLNVGMVLRLGSFIVAAVLLLMTMKLFFESRDVEARAAEAKRKWEHLKPQHAELLALRVSLNELRASSRQVEACRRSRLPQGVGAELTQLQLGVPEEIQLQELRLSQFVGTPKAGAVATRTYELRIKGKVAGEDPKRNVDELIGYLSAAAYTNRMLKPVIPNNSYRKETVRVPGTGEVRTDWFFELLCPYRPRSFE
jgi:hypothetical protein